MLFTAGSFVLGMAASLLSGGLPAIAALLLWLLRVPARLVLGPRDRRVCRSTFAHRLYLRVDRDAQGNTLASRKARHLPAVIPSTISGTGSRTG